MTAAGPGTSAARPRRLAHRLCAAGADGGAGRRATPVSDRAARQAAKLPDRLAERTTSGDSAGRRSGRRARTRAPTCSTRWPIAARGDLALTRALAARSASLTRYGQTYLALAFQRLGAPDDAKRLLDTIDQRAAQADQHRRPTGKNRPRATAEDWVSMSTNTRTTALVLDALIAANKNDPLIPKAVRWLMTARREGHWATTQETAQSWSPWPTT